VGSTYDVALVPNPSSVLAFQSMSGRQPVLALDESTAPRADYSGATLEFDVGNPDTDSVKATEVISLSGNVHSAFTMTNDTTGQRRTYGLDWAGGVPPPCLALRIESSRLPRPHAFPIFQPWAWIFRTARLTSGARFARRRAVSTSWLPMARRSPIF